MRAALCSTASRGCAIAPEKMRSSGVSNSITQSSIHRAQNASWPGVIHSFRSLPKPDTANGRVELMIPCYSRHSLAHVFGEAEAGMNIFDRAKELARGDRSMDTIIRTLKAERFENVEGYLSPTFRRELRKIREEARTKK